MPIFGHIFTLGKYLFVYLLSEFLPYFSFLSFLFSCWFVFILLLREMNDFKY